jgi:molybdenum cofactor cytidylyltransferase
MGCILKGSSGLWSRLSAGAVLLATGADERLAGRPAALLELGGVPLILRQLIALSGAGVDELAVVLGHDAAQIEPVLQAFPIHVVHDPEPGLGAPASLGRALPVLSPRLDAVIVAPGALPLVDAQDVTALIGAFKKRAGAALVVPRAADGEPGAALIAEAALRDQWIAAGVAAEALRGAGSVAGRVAWLDVAHRRLHTVIRSVGDIDAFATATGHRLSGPAVDAARSGGALETAT